jgi:hypothetical protein
VDPLVFLIASWAQTTENTAGLPSTPQPPADLLTTILG